MKRLAQILPVFLAAALQLMPMVRNFIFSPATGSSFAFILRWGIGSAAAIGSVDAVSGASNYFSSASNFTATVGVFFTNNLTLHSSSGDGGALCTITSNGVAVVIGNSQTTNFAMPAGLKLKFIDVGASANPVYVAISGTPTTPQTNNFRIDLFYAGAPTVGGDFSIKVSAASGGTTPTISGQPVGATKVAGSSASFSVTASGTPAPVYQWRFNNANLAGAVSSTLSLANLRASQAGNYTVVITNSAGAVTSSVAVLAVTNPLPVSLTSPVNSGGGFQFTFIPTVGLTNTVQASGNLNGGAWNVFSNVPPPVSAIPVTVTDVLGSSNRFYRVLVQP